MAQLRPYINNTSGNGVYFPIIQSNPRSDMYTKGMLSDKVSAAYRRRQRKAVTQHPAIDKIHGPLLNPVMTPSAMSMIGSGKSKSKVRAPFDKGYGSKNLAFYNDAGISAKKPPKMVKGTLGKLGPKSVAREPTFNPKINRYVK